MQLYESISSKNPVEMFFVRYHFRIQNECFLQPLKSRVIWIYVVNLRSGVSKSRVCELSLSFARASFSHYHHVNKSAHKKVNIKANIGIRVFLCYFLRIDDIGGINIL